MVKVSEAAASKVRELAAQVEDPDSVMLRIASAGLG